MKNLYKILTLSICSSFLVSCAKQDGPASVPVSWHKLPEQNQEAPQTSEEVEPSEAVSQSVVQIFDATESSLEESVPEPRPEDKWVMKNFVTDLSISAKGVLGLVIKGTPSVTLEWKKKEPKNDQLASVFEESAPDFLIEDAPDSATIPHYVNELTHMTKGMIKVENEGVLRKNFHTALVDFFELADALNTVENNVWTPNRLRLDMSIDGSGKVAAGPTIGGALRLRLQWHKTAKGKPALLAHKILTERAQSLKNLVLSLSEDLLATEKHFESMPGFKADSFRVGIGSSVKGKLGVVKGSAEVLGHVYFKRTNKKPKVGISFVDHTATTFPLIVGPELEKPVLAIANTYGFHSTKDESGSLIVDVNRKAFRTGLKKSAQIAKFFTKKAQNVQGSKWRINVMKLGLDLSASGDVGLVEVAGIVAAEIAFKNTNF